MPSMPLPILTLPLNEQRYSCHGCGNCCRDFTVQLRADDLEKLQSQRWEERLGEPITIEHRGVTFLRQRTDGACIFLQADGRCRVHAEFGFENKPIACQLFPFSLIPSASGVGAGVNFACQSVLENKGAALASHAKELARMMQALPETQEPAAAPMLNDTLRAGPDEVRALTRRLDDWLKRTDHRLRLRLDGLAWAVSSLAAARLNAVRGGRFEDLLDVLLGALPQELEHHPIKEPTQRQMKMLRRAVFARIEDPKLDQIKRQSRLKMTLGQLLRERRLASGKGAGPRVGHGWPGGESVQLEHVDAVQPASEASQAAIDDVITRWIRATILGGRAWGAGYYGWPIVRGLQALLLNVACVGWLARLHAVGRGHSEIDIMDVRAAIGRVDRAAGRAPWLGSAGELLRLKYLAMDNGLRRLVAREALVDERIR